MKRGFVLVATLGVFTFAVADGEKLFKKCAICHGQNGEKQSLGVSEIIAGWKAEEVKKILHEYKDRTRDTYGFGTMMGGQATKLSDEQMQQVSEYVEKLKAE